MPVDRHTRGRVLRPSTSRTPLVFPTLPDGQPNTEGTWLRTSRNHCFSTFCALAPPRPSTTTLCAPPRVLFEERPCTPPCATHTRRSPTTIPHPTPLTKTTWSPATGPPVQRKRRISSTRIASTPTPTTTLLKIPSKQGARPASPRNRNRSE